MSSEHPIMETVESIQETLHSQQVNQEAKPYMSSTGKTLMGDLDKTLEEVAKYLKEGGKGDKLEVALRHASRAATATTPDAWKNLKDEDGKAIFSEEDAEKAYEEAKTATVKLLQCARLVVMQPEFRNMLKDLPSKLMAIFEDETDIHAEASNSEKAEKVGRVAKDALKEKLGGPSSSSTRQKGSGYAGKDHPKQEASYTEPQIKPDKEQENPYQPSSEEREASEKVKATTRRMKHEMIETLAGAIEQFQRNAEYQESIEYLFSSITRIYSLLRHGSKILSDEVKRRIVEEEYSKRQYDPQDSSSTENINPIHEQYLSLLKTREFLEEAAGSSLTPFLNACTQFGSAWEERIREQDYFSRLEKFFIDLLKDPKQLEKMKRVLHDVSDNRDAQYSHLDDASFKQEVEYLFGAQSPFYDAQIRHTFNEIRKKSNDFFVALQSKPSHTAIADDVQMLVKDLLYDAQGNPAFKPELLRDLQVILPALVNRIQDLPIPDIQTADDDYDFLLENITLHTKNLFPGMFKIKAKSQMKMQKAESTEVFEPGTIVFCIRLDNLLFFNSRGTYNTGRGI
jgi:Family of unknown function (DUF5923)